jgi:hypothetical protein
MPTANDLIEETRRHLFSGQTEEMNRLAVAVDADDTSMTFAYDLGGLRPGAVISIDLEEIYVWETSGKIATVVQRGVNGTTGASHSVLAVATVRPKFSAFRILSAINHDLMDLSAPDNGLYQIKTVTLDYSAAIQGYDLTAVASNLLGIAEVRYNTPGPDKSWPTIHKWALRRNMPIADFPSGTALVLYDSGYPGQELLVSYKAPFTALASLSDDVTTAGGLPASAVDLPSLGAALRLVSGRDVKRAFSEHQGDTRRADEVRVGDGAQSMRGMMMIRQSRINAERSRLLAQYPNTLVW